jgi:hypothetical protein
MAPGASGGAAAVAHRRLQAAEERKSIRRSLHSTTLAPSTSRKSSPPTNANRRNTDSGNHHSKRNGTACPSRRPPMVDYSANSMGSSFRMMSDLSDSRRSLGGRLDESNSGDAIFRVEPAHGSSKLWPRMFGQYPPTPPAKEESSLPSSKHSSSKRHPKRRHPKRGDEHNPKMPSTTWNPNTARTE